MNVMKRDGTLETMCFDKIMRRLRILCQEIQPCISLNLAQLVIRVVDKLQNNIKTQQIDELTAQECAALTLTHPDYAILAARIVLSNNHKSTPFVFTQVVNQLAAQLDENFVQLVRAHHDKFQPMLDYRRDFLIDYFGFKTLEKSYLLKSDGVVVERAQHMWLRVAIQLHWNDFDQVKETYDLMSLKYMTHATPTLFNACTLNRQLSSCFLIQMKEDSIDGIYETLSDCAKISKHAGGIGLHIHNVRAKGSPIQGTNGTSNGLIPMLKVFNETARYVDQGGGKRNGSFSIYLSPDHADVEAWLDLKKNTGDENARARDLFYALWVPDLFMKRVENNAEWSLFCPHTCPGLSDVYGEEYDALYETYEKEGRAVKTVPAQQLWFKILDAQMETGNPSILFKDACNRKSNQKNVGVIKSSNLCTEIVQYSSPTETAVCNLASIALSAFVDVETAEFDYFKLHQVAKVLTRNLNKIIDMNYYPTEKTRVSNLRHRPIGIGVQGLADVYFKMDIPFHSNSAMEVNKLIFETIYHGAMEASVELARETCPYSSFEGSPLSQGHFQFDLWGVAATDRYDWAKLRSDVVRFGVRNSLLVAPMPTASTSQILGNNECFEPVTSNIYTRRTSAGEFVVMNKYLVSDLLKLGLWNESIKNNIIANNGSVQQLDISTHLKEKYKTVWEMPMRHIINMARDRGAYICQSQSLNLFIADPTVEKLTSMHFYSWREGLKTGLYYLRRQPRYKPQKVTIAPSECLTCSS